jgi:hypothetical protein
LRATFGQGPADNAAPVTDADLEPALNLFVAEIIYQVAYRDVGPNVVSSLRGGDQGVADTQVRDRASASGLGSCAGLIYTKYVCIMAHHAKDYKA